MGVKASMTLMSPALAGLLLFGSMPYEQINLPAFNHIGAHIFCCACKFVALFHLYQTGFRRSPGSHCPEAQTLSV